MKVLIKLAACAAAVAVVAACGQERGADGLTAEEREKLNTHAEKQDADAEIIDVPADSLVANDEWIAAEAGEAAPPADNGAAANGQ